MLPTREEIRPDPASQVVCNLGKTVVFNTRDKIKTIYNRLRLCGKIIQSKTLETPQEWDYDCVAHSSISSAQNSSWHAVSPY